MLSTCLASHSPTKDNKRGYGRLPVWRMFVVLDEPLDDEVEDSEAGNTNTEEDKSEKKRLYRSCMISDTWCAYNHTLPIVGEKIKNFLLVRVRLFYLQDSTDIVVVMDWDVCQDILTNRTVKCSERESCGRNGW